MASKFKVTRFDGTENFRLWQTRVKDLLAQQGISRALDEKKPTTVDDDKWEEMQAQACAMMRLCLADQIMYHSWMKARLRRFGTTCPRSLCPRLSLGSCI
jgi:hypothetical protein